MTDGDAGTADPATYDLVVLGAGPVGENVAQYATEGTGLTAVLVEGELVGGECSYYACMPSKALLRPIEVADAAAHLPGLSRPALDRQALLARRDDWVSHYRDDGQVAWAGSAGLDVVRGHGRIAAERVVEVDTPQGSRTLRARRTVVIATGSAAIVPEGYAACLPWSSRDATGVREVPERLVIVGGGVVACESALWMAALGARVTMLVRADRLLPKIEPDAAELVRAGLVERGVDVRLGTRVGSIERAAARDTGLGRIHGGLVRLDIGDATLEAEEVLLAVGRRPRLGDVGLESVGLSASDVLAERLPDWLRVVGDASGEAPLTHWGKYRARVLGEHLAAQARPGDQPAPQVPPQVPSQVPPIVPVPQVVFTDPQVGTVGLTEAEARAGYPQVVVAAVPWTAAAGAALLRDDAPGLARLVVDATTGRLLGATFVGPGAGELLHAATVAIVGQLPVHLLRHAVPAYPTASELWLRLLEALPTRLRHPGEAGDGGGAAG